MDSYTCDTCNKTVHCSNRVVHSLRCQRVSQAEVQARPVDQISSEQRNAHAKNFCQIEQQSQSLDALNKDAGALLPYCECPRCTFHNDVGVEECGVCGFNFFGTEERPPDYSQNEHHGNENCTLSTGEQWQCGSCTYENEQTDRQCQVCHSVRPPLRSYSERLIDEDDHNMEDTATSESGAAYAWTSAIERGSDPAETEEFPHSIASAMLLGAGIGAGLAWLNRSDVSSGALAGAGIGAASDMALREISAAQRMRQAQLHQRRMMEQQFGDTNYPPVRSFQGDEDVFDSMLRRIAARRAAPGSLNTDGLLMQAVLSSLVARRAAGVRGERGGALAMDIDSMPFEALLERFPAPPRGVDAAMLSALPVRPFVEPSAPPTAPTASGESENESARTCSICMEQYAGGEEVKTLPCLHCFHSACVDHWLREHHTCPVCKHSLV